MIHAASYTITGTIHEGARTILYAGYNNATRARVVLKTIKGDYPTPREAAKLQHEYTLLRELDVPGVGKALGLEKHENGYLLVLAPFNGRSLHAVLRSQPLDVGAILRIGASVARILSSLHRVRVIHKDIKPHNILVNTDTFDVSLIDFGIAARLSREPVLGLPPEGLEGTLAYISPEQTGRVARSVDGRSDLYSLGVTLYEMLTHALPFPATEDPIKLLHSHIARRPTPPRQIAPKVPEVVSAIVMKLLEKAPEERYQTGRGLAEDLDECRQKLASLGTIPAFPLGRNDRSDELVITQTLYGRDEERKFLMAALDRACVGASELLLIAGDPGVGKSALVQALHEPVAVRGGYFVSGKFDQLSRSTPYAPVMHAFRDLCRQICQEAPEAFADWKERLTAALSPNGKILVELIPELELIVGPQPDVQPLGPTESHNRFTRVLLNFFSTFTFVKPPLILFLDDLQWADQASLTLLAPLLAGGSAGHLLVIGAYRDSEVDGVHPLPLAIHELRTAGASICELLLASLPLESVQKLIEDVLGREPLATRSLAELMSAKTQGNPFFLKQLLIHLHKEGLLVFDAAQLAWTWDVERIAGVDVTDNVVGFMVWKLQQLAPATQRVLMLAACIGFRFDLRMLAVIHETTPAATAGDLREAIDEGFVVPLGADGASGASGVEVAYHFLHDRVQQAAYALIDEDQRQVLHLQIGRLMKAKLPSAPPDPDLFNVVNQMNLGAALITDTEERLDLARLNLAAGKKAKTAAAYTIAIGYIGAGAALIGEEGWERAPRLHFDLCVEQAECDFLRRRFSSAELTLRTLLDHAQTSLEKASVYNIWGALCSSQNRFREAVDLVLSGLALFGLEVPAAEEERAAMVESERVCVDRLLSTRPLAGLADGPVLADPSIEAVMQLLVNLAHSSYTVSSALTRWSALRLTALSLEHGNSHVSAYGFVGYGCILAETYGRPQQGYDLGQVALDLNERFNSLHIACKLHVTLGAYAHFARPLQVSIAHYAKARKLGLESGDLTNFAYACYQTTLFKWSQGEELKKTLDESDKLLELVQQAKNPYALAMLTATRQSMKSLLGLTRERGSLSDDTFDEAAFVARMEAIGLLHVTCFYYAAKLQLLFLEEDFAGALAMAERAEERLPKASVTYFGTEVRFYAALALLALLPASSPDERQRHMQALQHHIERIARWAEICPENHRHKYLLVLAEHARVEGNDHEAAELYDEAIALAWNGDFTQVEALAKELCGKFYDTRGKATIARAYMTEAYYAYVRWGATAKLAQLREKHADRLFLAILEQHGEKGSLDKRMTTTGERITAGGPDPVDVAAVIRSAQAIAGEIVLDKVLERLMQILIENAGAQRGVLMLERDGNLTIEATAAVDPDVVQIGPSSPVERGADLPLSVVQYVRRAKQPVILGDATRDPTFANDLYLVASKPRSLLCLALTHQGRLTGLLYLENRVTADAFPPSRVELVSLISAQAAIAIENALLYGDLNVVTEELRCANQKLTIELTERAHAEEERAALQGEIIQAQQDRLSELSTPLMPITDGIMVMPLIGTIDEGRAQQILEAALHGAQVRKAQVVILDITGVKQVDLRVAGTLLRTAAALRLLGAQAVLSGVRPEVAQTFIRLEIDLSGIVTRGTLQSSMAWALARTGGARPRSQTKG